MAGLARALKHGPRRSFGKLRHADAEPSPSKVALVIPQTNSTTSTPNKTFESSPGTQKTSTLAQEDSTPPSRQEKTPDERDSSLFKDPPPLFGHCSVLFSSAEFDAIFEKYTKEDEEGSKTSEPGENSSETKQPDTRSSLDRKPTPSKKPEVSTKPNWTMNITAVGCYDDSDVLPKLEKESKENKGLFAIDDFVMASKQEEVNTESAAIVKSTSSDPPGDEKKEKSDEMALEDFPPKQSASEDVPQKETSKEPEKETQSTVDSNKFRIRHGSTEKNWIFHQRTRKSLLVMISLLGW